MASLFLPSPRVPAHVDWVSAVYDGAAHIVLSGNTPSLARALDTVAWDLHRATSLAGDTAALIGFNGSVYVMLSHSRRHVHTSSDGINWTKHADALPATYNLRGIASIGSRFVVVTAGSNNALTSTDGINWTVTAMTYVGDAIGVVANGSEFVAFNQNGRIATSTDGVAWTYPVAGTTATSLGFAAKAGLYLRSFTGIQSSPDGVTWTTRLATINVTAIVWTGAQFVGVVGNSRDVYTSPDGITWTQRVNAMPWQVSNPKIFWLGSKLLILSQALNSRPTNLLLSDDGISFTSTLLPAYAFENQPRPAGASQLLVNQPTTPVGRNLTSDKGEHWHTTLSTQLFDVRFEAGLFVAFSTADIYSSTDGATFVDRGNMFNSFNSTIAFNGSSWVICSNGYTQLKYSPDGVNWFDSTIPYAATTLRRAVATRTGTFYLLGAGGTGPSEWLTTSLDGETWTPVEFELPNISSWAGNIAFNGAAFAAFASEDTVVRSDDGVSWATVTLPTPGNWYWLAAGGPRFWLVAPDEGEAQYSVDNGLTWIVAATWTPSGAWFTPGYGNGRFVLIGDDDTSQMTIDGNSWTEGALPDSVGNGYYAVGGNSSVIVAASWDFNIAAVSSDGVNWTEVTLPITAGWDFVLNYGEILFIVSNEGYVLRSTDDGVSWQLLNMPAGEWDSALVDEQGLLALGEVDGYFATSRLGSGTLWTTNVTSIRVNPAVNAGYTSTYGNGHYFFRTDGNQLLLHSTDGVQWSNALLGDAPIFAVGDVSGDALLTGYRHTFALVQSDGSRESVPSPSEGFEIVALGGNSRGWVCVFLDAIDNVYRAKFSSDGRYWTELELPEIDTVWKDVRGFGTTFYLTASYADRFWSWEAPFWTGFVNSEET